jgi:FtsP/CotA-like multicopper oxidase with cupredoxin domain
MIKPTGSQERPWRPGDHVFCHGQPYTVLGVDNEGVRARLVCGDSAVTYSAFGRIVAPVADLAWRA